MPFTHTLYRGDRGYCKKCTKFIRKGNIQNIQSQTKVDHGVSAGFNTLLKDTSTH